MAVEQPNDRGALQPGTRVAGRFDIIRCLGVGSMGVVYLGVDIAQPEQLLAIKVLSPSQALGGSDAMFFERFDNEVKACSQVTHRHVVSFKEFINTDGLVAYTMEYVGGGDLAWLLRDVDHFAIPHVISLLDQMAQGVEAIHKAGIIHRDLKPENILLTESGEVKIADFGIARVDGMRKITAPGGVVGTIDYLSPQYLESGIVDAQGDIYSLGVLAYELITGKPPFQGTGFFNSIDLKLHTIPTPPHEINLECPRLLSNVVMKALRYDLNERYKTVAEMHADLRPLLAAYFHEGEFAPTVQRRPTSSISTGPKVVEIVNLREFYEDGANRPVQTTTTPTEISRIPTQISVGDTLAGAGPLPTGPAIKAQAARRPSRYILGGVGTLLGMLIVFLVIPRLGLLDRSIPSEIATTEPAVGNDTESSKADASEQGREVGQSSAAAELASGTTKSMAALKPATRTEEATSAQVIAGGQPPVRAPAGAVFNPEVLNDSKPVGGNVVVPDLTQPAVVQKRTQQKLLVSQPAGTLASERRAPPVAIEPVRDSAPPPEQIEQQPSRITGEVPEPPLQYKIRATLLYRFADYVEWPNSAFQDSDSPFRVCLVGQDPFGGYLDYNLSRIKSRSSRSFEVTRISASESVSHAEQCQIMYVTSREAEKVNDLVARIVARKQPVLVVAEAPGAGMIGFVTQDRKVKFEIHSKRAMDAGLHISPLLLDLATRVD